MKDATEEIGIGARVRIVPQHWLRGFEEGLIVDFQPHAMNRWLVRFDVSYPGGGIDGDKLWMDESQFAEVKHVSNTAGDAAAPTVHFRDPSFEANIDVGSGGKRTLSA